MLIVQKVLSDESELEPYIKTSKTIVATSNPLGVKMSEQTKQIDLSKSRAKAARTSERLGQFLMPFAFGVVNLQQAVGNGTSPASPTSIMVQIPLFKLTSGIGDKPIIDHIMVMLYPR